MNAWLVVVAIGLGTYLFRLSMIAFADRVLLPARLEQVTALVAPAAFAALAASGITAACAGAAAAEAVPALTAVAVAVVAVLRTGRSYAAMLAGMPVLWLTSALVPVLERVW